MIAIMSDELAGMFSGAPAREMPQGATIFAAGDPVTHVFRLETGEAALRRVTPGGAELVLQRAGPADVLAEASVYSDSYHCDAVTRSQGTRLRAIPRKAFLDALEAEPVAARAWARRLARAVQSSRALAEIRTLRTVSERLEAWESLGGVFPGKGRIHDVAAELGVTREALYRELARRRQ